MKPIIQRTAALLGSLAFALNLMTFLPAMLERSSAKSARGTQAPDGGRGEFVRDFPGFPVCHR